jgi:hypothetical protein
VQRFGNVVLVIGAAAAGLRRSDVSDRGTLWGRYRGATSHAPGALRGCYTRRDEFCMNAAWPVRRRRVGRAQARSRSAGDDALGACDCDPDFARAIEAFVVASGLTWHRRSTILS